jgi:hypothetical protein
MSLDKLHSAKPPRSAIERNRIPVLNTLPSIRQLLFKAPIFAYTGVMSKVLRAFC